VGVCGEESRGRGLKRREKEQNQKTKQRNKASFMMKTNDQQRFQANQIRKKKNEEGNVA
jgi:hypothetical protein